MLVARQRFMNSLIFHHHKRNAIGERPVFIAPFAHSRQVAIEKIGSERNNFHTRTGAHPGHERQKIGGRRYGLDCSEMEWAAEDLEMSRLERLLLPTPVSFAVCGERRLNSGQPSAVRRSEEHTSEL